MSERIESFDLSSALWPGNIVARVLRVSFPPLNWPCIVLEMRTSVVTALALSLFGVALPVSAHADVYCSAPCLVDSDGTQGNLTGATTSSPTGHQPISSACWQTGNGCEQNYDDNISASSGEYSGTGSAMDDDGMQADHVTSGNKSSPQTHVAGGTPQATCGGYNYPC